MNRPRTLFLLFCLGTIAAGAARADKAGDALLDRCIQAETKTPVLQADYSSEIVRGRQTVTVKGHFVLKKPNVAHIVYTGTGGDKDETVHSDGRKMLHYMESEKQYTRETPDLSGGNVVRMASSLEAMVFFNPDLLNQFRGLGSGLKIVGTMTIGGVSCQALQATVRDGNIYKIYIGPDSLLHGITQIMGKGDTREVLESRLTGLRTDAGSAANALVWNPPAKAKLVEQITLQASSGGSGASPGAELLAIGSAAPAFDLATVTGEKMSLPALTKPNKVVLVNFWDYG
jgi:outer membrane lipoprotein-sorting protein